MNQKTRLPSAVALAVILAFCLISAGHADPAPRLLDDIAVVPGGGQDGAAALRIVVSDLNPTDLANEKLLHDTSDVGAPKPADVKPDIPSELPHPDEHSRAWIVLLNIHGLPANTSQLRFLTFSLGDKKHTLPYTLTNIPGSKFSWTVKSVPSTAVTPDGAIPIFVTVGPVPVTSVHVAQSTLMEKVGKTPLSATDLRLCTSSTDPCDTKTVQLAANSSPQLWIRGKFRPGQYDGSLIIATPEKPEGELVTLTVFCSCWGMKIFGIVLILLGVVAGWFATVFARNLLNRDQMLLPAVDLRARLAAAKKSITDVLQADSTKPPAPQTLGAIDRILVALGDAQLELNGLPQRFPLPWAATPALSTIDTYRKYLQDQTTCTTALESIVTELLFSWSKWSATNAAAQGFVRSSVTNIDGLEAAATVPSVDTLRTQLAGFRTTLLNQLAAPAPGVAAAVGAAPVATSPMTPAELRVQITRVGEMAWAFIFLATTLVGCVVLIFQSSAAGFGTPLDLLTCLLWGFGFSTGSQLLNSTTASVATTFGVTR